jgi:uncharacterized membrane protein YeaQ/YmgE (transglycosylase-associated protein family)
MGLFGFFFLLLIASVCGALGARIAGRRGLGCLTSIVLGFIGALIGTFIARQLDLPLFPWIRFGDNPFPVVWAVLGAALFVALLNLLSRPGK